MGWNGGGKGYAAGGKSGDGFGGGFNQYDMAYAMGMDPRSMAKGGFGGFGKGGPPQMPADWNSPKTAKGLVKGLCNTQTLPGGKRWENNESTIFVGGLPEDTTDLDMYHIFSPFGAVAPKGASARKDPETGRCTGIGFVNYMDASSMNDAIKTLNGTMMSDGTRLTVKIKGPPKNKGDGKGCGMMAPKGGKGGKSAPAAPEGPLIAAPAPSTMPTSLLSQPGGTNPAVPMGGEQRLGF